MKNLNLIEVLKQLRDDLKTWVTNTLREAKADIESRVPQTRTINNKALSANITLTSTDVGADAAGTAQTKANAAKTSANSYTDEKIAALVDGAGTYKTINALEDAVLTNKSLIDNLDSVKADISSVTKESIGLGNTDNISDVNKGISTAQAAMLRSLELRIHELESVIYNNQFMITTPIPSPDSYFNINNAGVISGLSAECEAASEIVFPSKINGVNVTGIGDGRFYSNNVLTSAIITNGMTSIGNYAFAYCENLTNVVIPDSVTSIGINAFNECPSLASITIPNGVTSIGEWTFNGCANLTSITIPDSVTSIGDYAFAYCTNLASLIIPGSVTNIGNEVFGNCTKLNSIVIPDGVTNIGEYAFYKCTNLTSIIIPDGVTSISEGTFNDCTKLNSIVIPDSVTSIGDKAFKGCANLTNVSYAGTKEQWNSITIGSNNGPLTNATITYN